MKCQYLIFGATLEHHRVHFCQNQDHDQDQDYDQDHDDEINPIVMYDSSNESSQRTEEGSVKRFDVLKKNYGKTAFFAQPDPGRTEGEIYQKVLVQFKQTRSQMKAYYYCFLF